MNRKLWGSVIGIVAVLGTLDYAAGGGGGGGGGVRSVARAAGAVGARMAPALARALERVSSALSWDLVGLLVVVVLGLTLTRIRRRRPRGHREPWTRVVQLGREGRSVASIAQVTRQSHDVVRILLAPVAVERVPVGGKSFRPSASGPAGGPADGRLGRRS